MRESYSFQAREASRAKTERERAHEEREQAREPRYLAELAEQLEVRAAAVDLLLVLHRVLNHEVFAVALHGLGERRRDHELLHVADRLDAAVGRIAMPRARAPGPLALRRARARRAPLEGAAAREERRARAGRTASSFGGKFRGTIQRLSQRSSSNDSRRYTSPATRGTSQAIRLILRRVARSSEWGPMLRPFRNGPIGS